MGKMKIWKGYEQEGIHKGIKTLFVKGPKVKTHVVTKFLADNPDCKRLYLGAGRTDIQLIDYPLTLLQYCSENGISVVNEVSYENLDKVPNYLKYDSEVVTIIRIQSPKLQSLKSTDLIKLDTEKAVYIKPIIDFIETLLDDLKGDIFISHDVVLYEEEDE